MFRASFQTLKRRCQELHSHIHRGSKIAYGIETLPCIILQEQAMCCRGCPGGSRYQQNTPHWLFKKYWIKKMWADNFNFLVCWISKIVISPN